MLPDEMLIHRVLSGKRYGFEVLAQRYLSEEYFVPVSELFPEEDSRQRAFRENNPPEEGPSLGYRGGS